MRTSPRRRALRAALVPLTMLLASIAPTAQAAAPDPTALIGLSWDGQTWSSVLAGTLFNRPGSIQQWVPGDLDTQSFFVRDQAPDPASMTVSYDWPSSARLVSNGDFTLRLRVAGGSWMVLGGATSTTVATTVPLAAGAAAKVDVEASFRFSSTNQSQIEIVPLRFEIRLSEGARPLTDGGAVVTGGGVAHHGHLHHDKGSGGSGAHLADTGAPEFRWVALGALLCLSAGGALLAGARRRKKARR